MSSQDTISIVGAGSVARGIATRALGAGYAIELLVRNPEQGTALAEELGGQVTVAGIGTAPTGDIVALAVPWTAVPEIVAAFGGFAGTILVDATNPAKPDFSGLATAPDKSGAEELAELAPQARIVKAFNTVFANNVVAGEKNGAALDLLVAGDEAEAKAAVIAFAEKAGFRPIDTGGLIQARTMEALAWLHIQLQFSRGTNFTSAFQLVD
jgi:predicted dinucleotide-binding enzyme